MTKLTSDQKWRIGYVLEYMLLEIKYPAKDTPEILHEYLQHLTEALAKTLDPNPWNDPDHLLEHVHSHASGRKSFRKDHDHYNETKELRLVPVNEKTRRIL